MPTASPPAPKSITIRTYRAPVAGLRELPDEIRVVPWGRNQTANGLLVCDEYTASVFAANQRRRGFEQTHGDFEHQTVPRKGYVPAEPLMIACDGSFEVRTPAESDKPGLYFVISEWKDAARQYVAGGHYPDVSVACEQDAQGRILSAHSFGFCRHGAVSNASTFSVAMPALFSTTQTTSMLKEALIKALRDAGQEVADDISDEALAAAVEAMAGKKAAAPDPATYSSQVAALLKPFSSQLEVLTTSMKKLEAGQANNERATVVAELTRDGVIIPLSPEMLTRFSAAELRAESAKWPKGEVPAADGSASTPAAGEVKTYAAGAAGSRQAAADKLLVAKQLGLKPEEL